ncbi:hypothetical protein RJT34_26745 [Clitoria ternatea]|uniref:Uncharacterized protein n=1 Tax=Clitoria ternatea TaxID=43366 RepID=A0AAN9F773_CLITE
MGLKFCSIRSKPRRFGISFTAPDRVTSEINDKKRIMGKHPLRITRIPSGGPSEFHKLIQEAKELSTPLTLKNNKNGVSNKLLVNHKRAYHRSHFNDWYVEVFYMESFNGNNQTSEPNS